MEQSITKNDSYAIVRLIAVIDKELENIKKLKCKFEEDNRIAKQKVNDDNLKITKYINEHISEYDMYKKECLKEYITNFSDTYHIHGLFQNAKLKKYKKQCISLLDCGPVVEFDLKTQNLKQTKNGKIINDKFPNYGSCCKYMGLYGFMKSKDESFQQPNDVYSHCYITTICHVDVEEYLGFIKVMLLAVSSTNISITKLADTYPDYKYIWEWESRCIKYTRRRIDIQEIIKENNEYKYKENDEK